MAGDLPGMKWRFLLLTPKGEVDATDLSLQSLPHLWRDRFYIDLILHNALAFNQEQGGGQPSQMLQRLFTATEKVYSEKQTNAHADPTILNARFATYGPPQQKVAMLAPGQRSKLPRRLATFISLRALSAFGGGAGHSTCFSREYDSTRQPLEFRRRSFVTP